MGSILNIIIIILVVGWLIGYFGFGDAVGGIIHILIILAVVALIFRLATGRRL